MRFPMTLDRFTRRVSVLALAGLVVVFTVQLVLMPPGLRWLALGPLILVVATFGLTVAWSPSAVKLTGQKLSVERRWWAPYEVPLRTITSVEKGPAISLWGPVKRVAGNGGMLGYTGLYHVSGVGLVRCWATQLGRQTVLVRRRGERPVLLGVDDPAALTAALERAVPGARA